MPDRRRAPARPQDDAPITPVVVRSLEPVDLPEFLARYARAIVEAKGTRPNPTASSPEAA